MNYINRPKSAYTQEERIKYLEESIRELRKEKENLKKEKGELRQRLLKMQKNQDELLRVKENKELREENDRLKNNAMEDMRIQTKLEEKIRFLEECLDNKEKVNKQLREEIQQRINAVNNK